jgi:hypothetical protein
MRNDDDAFTYSVLPLDPDDPDNPGPPLPEAQQMALDDVVDQLISKLVVAAKDRSDPLRAVRVLSACHAIARAYADDGFDIFTEFERALRTDLHNALRMARRVFLRNGFLLQYPSSEYAAFKQVLTETGWRMSDPEARQDLQMVERELFDGDHFRPSALAERKRRRLPPD